MGNGIDLSNLKDKGLAKQVIDNQNEIDKIQLERGWLGNIWGNSEKIPNNIAALSVVFLLLTGLAYTYWAICTPTDKISLSIKDFWSIIAPLITLSIGYLFGNKPIESS